MLRRLPDKLLLSNLKRLALRYHTEFDLNMQNEFSQSVYLEISFDFKVKEIELEFAQAKRSGVGLLFERPLSSVDCPELNSSYLRLNCRRCR